MTPQQIAHREYLKSATWKDIREEVLKRDNYICQKCHKPGSDVHHKTYKNWTNEKLEDLITLCRGCHEQWHSTQKATRKNKAIGTRAIWNYLKQEQKNQLCQKFNLNEISLYTNIYIYSNSEICKSAAKLLGYKNWYSQTSIEPIKENKVRKPCKKSKKCRFR